ncbi:thymidine phosphorylase family protein [Colwellia sp. MB02u-10]|uniref:thymidine phosphorylase family protein n=1 Tax=Colwellia sp. MB02u-10 TaxID=2759828 RepID=UPI0015F6AC0F|nr:thymidine phosphorylase family protein [Colwellia sp. MB02u-10]MBA6342581.1 thymidine phosphorylase family protein [Colwellia sp. MB02u-10]
MLKLKAVAIDTFKENVAYLHRDCPLYRTEGFQALMKIEIYIAGNGGPVLAVLNIVDDCTIVDINELGLSIQAFKQLGKEQGVDVRIAPAKPPISLKAVHRKIAGESLRKDEFHLICQDILENRYSKMEIAAFLVACSHNGLERQEVLFLTKAMVDTGEVLNWGENIVVDKHCIGGIPGNRTTMIVMPIVAAHGMLMPKTSSRAITSPAGTADTMEVLANVELSIEEMKKVVHQHRAMLTWGGTARLAPVDDILISVERPLSMDSTGQLVASILSKKIAAGSTHLLIDIPVGPSAKIHNNQAALALRKLFEYIGDLFGLHIDVVISDGSQPIGNGVGPALEARDVQQVLSNHKNAPSDLREKSLRLAGRILEFDPDVRGGQGYNIARDILESGRAFEKMQAIILAQGASPKKQGKAPLEYAMLASKSGYVSAINNLNIAHIASLAGAPIEKNAGVDLVKKVADKVKKGDTLFIIYASFKSDFEFSTQFAHENSAYVIAKNPPSTDDNYFI